jgi:lipoprotein-releasing system permease protein
MKYESLVAFRYLRSKRKERLISFTTWIAVLGIGIGVMALILVIAVMTGMQDELKNRMLGVSPHILVMSIEGQFREPDRVVQQIKETDGVASATPFVTFVGLGQGTSLISFLAVKGVVPQDAGFLKPMMREGNVDSLKTKNTILVGREAAKELGLLTGDLFNLIVPNAGFSPAGAVPETVRVKVGGVFETGVFDFDNRMAFMSLADTESIIGPGITGVEVKVKDVYAAAAVRNRIMARLGRGYYGRTWIEMNKNLFSALKLEKIALFIILALIILVASFNIISSLVMTVMQKRKDIAILKAMGARNSSIMRIFVAEGLTIGVVGAVFGALMGYGLAEIQRRFGIIKLSSEVYFINVLPMKIDLLDIVLIAGVTILLCLISTLVPAYEASKIGPVEALRYE